MPALFRALNTPKGENELGAEAEGITVGGDDVCEMGREKAAVDGTVDGGDEAAEGGNDAETDIEDEDADAGDAGWVSVLLL